MGIQTVLTFAPCVEDQRRRFAVALEYLDHTNCCRQLEARCGFGDAGLSLPLHGAMMVIHYLFSAEDRVGIAARARVE